MPELPEVHTIVKDLSTYTSGYFIQNVSITSGYSVIPSNQAFSNTVLNKKILGAERIAKNIILKLENTNIGFHLAMTGRIFLGDVSLNDSWTKVTFDIKKCNEKKALRFTDARMFGKVKLYTNKELDMLKQRYGPEPLDEHGFEEFFDNMRKKKTNIKNFLLDQSMVSGMGNIYATDALFLAKVHPRSTTQNISKDIAKRIWDSARGILLEGILHRGSTLPDKMYVDIFGKEGTHQDHFKVYLKQNCSNCHGQIEYFDLNGRGTYACPKCQVTYDGRLL